jgi:hypothetical protein
VDIDELQTKTNLPTKPETLNVLHHLTGTRMAEEASFQGQLLDSSKFQELFELTVAGSLRESTKL